MKWYVEWFKNLFNFDKSDLSDSFTQIELEHVIPQLISYIGEQVKCENVIWVIDEELRRLHMTAKGFDNIEPEQQMYKHLKSQSLRPYIEKELVDHIAHFSPDNKAPQHFEHKGKMVVLLPILHLVQREPLAFIMLTGVDKAELGITLKKVTYTLKQLTKHITFSIQFWSAQRMSFFDDLTGIYNQKYLGMVLENEIARSQRDQVKFSVLFMDVDYFKSVNDTKGHWVGSRLLIEIARVMKRHVRRSDYAFRYGGDEYVIVLPKTNAENARIAAERIRSKIEQTEFMVDGEKIKLTLSIGLATFPDHAKTHREIIKMADEAMYCGKHKSRNVVHVAS